MKLLMEQWRTYLNEGMKTPNDIAAAEEDWFKKNPDMLKEVSVHIFRDGNEVYFVYAHNDEPAWVQATFALPELPAGYVAIRNAESRNYGPCLKGWSVSASEASGGWGPLLYDVAMEWTTKNAGGLMADRNTVSKDAYAVWDHYDKNRGDIESIQLDIIKGMMGGTPQLTPDDPTDDCSQYSSFKWLDYKPGEWHEQPLSRIFRKKGTPMMDKLQALGKLNNKT
jgi:hypothetical protein